MGRKKGSCQCCDLLASGAAQVCVGRPPRLARARPCTYAQRVLDISAPACHLKGQSLTCLGDVDSTVGEGRRRCKNGRARSSSVRQGGVRLTGDHGPGSGLVPSPAFPAVRRVPDVIFLSSATAHATGGDLLGSRSPLDARHSIDDRSQDSTICSHVGTGH